MSSKDRTSFWLDAKNGDGSEEPGEYKQDKCDDGLDPNGSGTAAAAAAAAAAIADCC